MPNTQRFKTKVQWLLFFLISIGLVSTTIICILSWTITQNLTNSIEALGNNAKLLTQGNLAVSNNIANYIVRQGRITSAESLMQLDSLEDKIEIEAEFSQHFNTLIHSLEGLEPDRANTFKNTFVQFNRLDDELFSRKRELLTLQKVVEQTKRDVILITARTQFNANTLARKVRTFEKEEINTSGILNNEQQNEADQLSNDFWGFSFGDDQEITKDVKTITSMSKEDKLEETKRVTNAIVDKNTKGHETKSVVSLHIGKLEHATQKLLLSADSLKLESIKKSEIIPELNILKTKLNKIKTIKISIEGFDTIVSSVIEDVSKLSYQLTANNNSLYASKRNLLIQTAKFIDLKKQLDQSRAELLTYLEALSQSGDVLVQSTSNKATKVINKSRDYITTIGSSVLLIFLIMGYFIAKSINRMTERINNQSNEMVKAHQVIITANLELQESNKQITESIAYASIIQQAIQSPEQEFSTFCKDAFVIWEPRDIVGGDMYLVRTWGNGKIIALIDCTGHGVSGAFMTILAKAALDKALHIISSGQTGQLISLMHRIIQTDLGQDCENGISNDGLDIGVCYIPDDKKNITFSGANISLVYLSKSKVIEIKGNKASIGYRCMESEIVFTEHKLELKQQTNFYLFTDGIIDQIGGEKAIAFGRRRLFDIIDKVANETMTAQSNSFIHTFAQYQGLQDRRDDITLIGLTIEPEMTTTHSGKNKLDEELRCNDE